jgi:DNA invertase Pin-like site-specific DNA recombinase
MIVGYARVSTDGQTLDAQRSRQRVQRKSFPRRLAAL